MSTQDSFVGPAYQPHTGEDGQPIVSVERRCVAVVDGCSDCAATSVHNGPCDDLCQLLAAELGDVEFHLAWHAKQARVAAAQREADGRG